MLLPKCYRHNFLFVLLLFKDFFIAIHVQAHCALSFQCRVLNTSGNFTSIRLKMNVTVINFKLDTYDKYMTLECVNNSINYDPLSFQAIHFRQWTCTTCLPARIKLILKFLRNFSFNIYGPHYNNWDESFLNLSLLVQVF